MATPKRLTGKAEAVLHRFERTHPSRERFPVTKHRPAPTDRYTRAWAVRWYTDLVLKHFTAKAVIHRELLPKRVLTRSWPKPLWDEFYRVMACMLETWPTYVRSLRVKAKQRSRYDDFPAYPPLHWTATRWWSSWQAWAAKYQGPVTAKDPHQF